MKTIRKDLQLLFWFHGHQCPMSTIGFRAGVLAAKLLSLKRKDYRHASAVVYFRSCALDGIQIGFPATFGNGNLQIRETKEMRFEFMNMRLNRKVTLTFAPLLRAAIDEFLTTRRKTENAGTKRDNRAALFRLLELVRRTPDIELFDIQETAS